MKKIAIIGAGNIGTYLVAELSSSGCEVILYSPNYKDFSNRISVIDENNIQFSEGYVSILTDNLELATTLSDIVLVTLPSYVIPQFAKKLIPFLKKGQMVGLIPGLGGGELAFKQAIQDVGCIVFGIQRVPAVARLVEYGKTVRVIGKREELFLASIPNSYSEEIANTIGEIFNIKCTSLPSYLCVSLTPSNPILHTTRLSVIFKDYHEGMVYSKMHLFYEEWDDESSELLLKCDLELQEMFKEMKEFDLSSVKSLKEHYESTTPEELTAKIHSIKGFKGLLTPMCAFKDGFVPDFNSRYFRSDFSFGLKILIDLAYILQIKVPHLKRIYNWYERIAPKEDNPHFKYSEYGITSYRDLLDFYL